MRFSVLKILVHLTLTLLLTALTQIGGIVYLTSIVLIPKNKSKFNIKRLFCFIIIYVVSTFLLVPNIAPLFGRIKINDSSTLKSHNYFIKICNRNYVTKKMNTVLVLVSSKINKEFPNVKLTYLDANFPFFDGFSLLPHLSHSDGKKVDLSFIYQDKNGKLINRKPSQSGYGIFENPTHAEKSQTNFCKQKGYWQYDFTKYLTFGSADDLKLSSEATKKLIELLLAQKMVHKVFLEPHLKSRFKIKNQKLRFHGCKAVRHDDHIHFQIQ